MKETNIQAKQKLLLSLSYIIELEFHFFLK